MATIKQVLQIARPELGVKESPPNSNRTKYGRWRSEEHTSELQSPS